MASKLHVCFLISLFIIACHACHKGHRKEDNKGATICLECESGTYMPEDNHNKTECYPCSKLKDANRQFVIRKCNKEEDAMFAWVTNDDLNKTFNITDQNPTAPSSASAAHVILNIVLILGTVCFSVLSLGLLIFQCMRGRSKHILDMCLLIVLSALAVCCLVILIVVYVYPVDWIFNLMIVIAFIDIALLAIISILNMLQRQHLSQKFGQGYAPPLLV